jgi:hypothetical protein
MSNETCPTEAEQEEKCWEWKEQMAEVVVVVANDLIDSNPYHKAEGPKPIAEDE